MLKKTTQQTTSVSTLLSQVAHSDEQLEANLSTMLQSVRGTKQYWFLRHSELKCMIRDYGPPTLFLTFSCAEYESTDIAEYLKILNDIPIESHCNIGKLCTEDPVSVSLQFSSKFHSFFQTVIRKGQVLGKVDHFYWKKKYQARGAPHYHVLLWIEDAPVIGRDKPDQVLTWIQDRITCHIPDKESSPEMYRVVSRYQMHKCSNYCKRRRKFGKNTFITKCKFGFPRPVSLNAKLNPVEESLKARNKIYELQRSETEVRVNDYNPLLLYLWKANIDIQFVAESSLALAHYVSGYVTKAERSNLQEIWQEVSENKSIYSRLWSFGVRSLRVRECGLYEAADLLLGDHLTEKSCTVKWVDTSMPQKRNHRLKSHTTLEEIAKTNPQSQDIFEDNLIENHYPSRPQRLNDLCLYDFVACIDWTSRDKHGEKDYKTLSKPRLPNHKLFDPEREVQREDYYYSLILLFVPFRDESNLLLPNEKAEEAFRRLTNANSLIHHQRLQKMLEAHSRIQRINQARHEGGSEAKITEDDDLQLKGEAKSAMDDALDLSSVPSSLDLETHINMLNTDQTRVFKKVKDHFLHQKRHEDQLCQCDLKPLRMFISGVGGTGKSFLIEAIRAVVASMWPSQDYTCAITAPTGLAAFNVGGITIHRLFQLPIEHEGKTAGYWSLSKGSHKTLKTCLRHVKVFIVDEVSMVSSLNLAYLHLRLEELFGSDEWFGGKNMLFVGDILQLQPVNGNPVFERIAQRSISLRLGCTTSINIWRDSVVYDELTINERQKTDPVFSNMLDRVRRGCPNAETIATLNDRVIHVSVAEKFKQIKEAGQTPVCLFPTRKACDELNNQMLSTLPSKLEQIPCSDDIDQTSSMRKWTKRATEHLEKLNRDCNMTAGLEANLNLAVGARVMLRRNIDTKAGLVNGAIGTVQKISATFVTVKFDHIKEPYNVERVKTRFCVLKNFYVYRTQFPLILAYAVTIHKCQGLSLDCAIVDLSEKVFSSGMAYVALSRVRSLSGLHLSAFVPSSIMASSSCLKEVNRLRQTFRKDLPLYDMPPKRRATKRKLSGDIDIPKARKLLKLATKPQTSITLGSNKNQTEQPSSRKRPNPNSSEGQSDPKRFCDLMDYDPRTEGVWPFSYNPVNQEWQQGSCIFMGLHFVCPNNVSGGGANVPLRRPDLNTLRDTIGDGNCFFRAISFLVTGSESQHRQVRLAITSHMLQNNDLFIQNGYVGCAEYSSIANYITATGMNLTGWGGTPELFAMAHLLRTRIFTYSQQHATWQLHAPYRVDPSLEIFESDTDMAMFLFHTGDHYKTVRSIVT